MAAERPRKSHFLPQFYLAGFTASGRVDDDLYVVDQATLREWPSCPKKAATERDLYVVELGPGEDPDVIEKIFSRLEGEFSRVLRDIIARRELPRDAVDFNWFLNFVASTATRIPHMREVMAGVIDKATKAELRQQLATAEGWARFREVVVAAGHQLRNVQHEVYKRFAESEGYSVNLDQTTHVQMMVTQLIDALLPALAERHWSLGIADDDVPDFVCSDMPVGVFPVRGADIGKPINLLSRETMLSFPINRRLVALARYNKRSPVQVVTAPGVRLFNYWTISSARQVFSPSPDFSLMTPPGDVWGKAELLEFLRRMKPGA
jgi:hypothetical protein